MFLLCRNYNLLNRVLHTFSGQLATFCLLISHCRHSNSFPFKFSIPFFVFFLSCKFVSTNKQHAVRSQSIYLFIDATTNAKIACKIAKFMRENQESFAHFASITEFFDLIGVSRLLFTAQEFGKIFRGCINGYKSD